MIKPSFTVAQADEVAIALSGQLEFRSENGMDCRATENALDALNRARFRDTNVSRKAPVEISKTKKGQGSV
jgi:hypothetical protein